LVDLTTAQINGSLLQSSNYWGGSTITFNFPGPGASWNGYAADQEPFKAEYAVLNANQQAIMRAELAVWDRLISPSLVETGDAGQIRIAFTNVNAFTSENSWGFAYSPPNQPGSGSPKAGDIWIDAGKKDAAFAPGSYDYMAAMHEMGHALGLKHTFEGQALPAAYDNYRYSIMSYTANSDSQWVTFTASGNIIQGSRVGVYPTTPMQLDVAAIQARYGADPTTAAGDTIYTFDQSKPIMQTIYDAGGNDTIDLSSHTRGSVVDLTPGAFSSIAKFTISEQAAFFKAQISGANSYIDSVFNSQSYTWTDNLATALNTVIENVRGGSGNDRILGNAANNNLTGGAGDDYIRGGDGADVLFGGAGFDDINGNKGADTAYGGEGNDWVVGGQDDDLLFGESGNDIVYGNLGNDTVNGGQGDDWLRGGQGDDVIEGGAGNDWLWGDRGNDTIAGGAGADHFHIFSGAGIDRVVDFSSAEGDRVFIDGGAPWTLSFANGEAIISLGNGDMMILSGISSAEMLGTWLG
jgi:serralysin